MKCTLLTERFNRFYVDFIDIYQYTINESGRLKIAALCSWMIWGNWMESIHWGSTITFISINIHKYIPSKKEISKEILVLCGIMNVFKSNMVLVSHSGDLAVVQCVVPYSNNKQSAFSVSNLTEWGWNVLVIC